MKLSLTIFLLSLILLTNCEDPNELNREVNFTQYTGYSYKSSLAVSGSTDRYYLKSKEAFDELFYFIYDHNEEPQIPESVLENFEIIGIVKCGNFLCELNVDSIIQTENNLAVYYRSEIIEDNLSWTAAIPIIVTFQADVQNVTYFENGKLVN